jgi:hypothetical protein
MKSTERDLSGKKVAILATDGFEQDDKMIEEFAEGVHRRTTVL